MIDHNYIQVFEDLFSSYYGKSEIKNDRIVFANVNELIDDCGISHRVLCKIQVEVSFIADPKRYSVRMGEKTCEIIGGSCCGSLTKEEAYARVKRGLERYRFKHKEMEQLSLL